MHFTEEEIAKLKAQLVGQKESYDRMMGINEDMCIHTWKDEKDNEAIGIKLEKAILSELYEAVVNRKEIGGFEKALVDLYGIIFR